MPSTVNVGDGEPVVPQPVSDHGPEHADAVDGPQPLVQPGRQRGLVGRDGLPADALQLVHGRAEGDRADDVGRAGLLPLGRLGPDDLVEVDQVDGATAGEEGVAASRTSRRGPISAPAPKGA